MIKRSYIIFLANKKDDHGGILHDNELITFLRIIHVENFFKMNLTYPSFILKNMMGESSVESVESSEEGNTSEDENDEGFSSSFTLTAYCIFKYAVMNSFS